MAAARPIPESPPVTRAYDLSGDRYQHRFSRRNPVPVHLRLDAWRRLFLFGIFTSVICVVGSFK